MNQNVQLALKAFAALAKGHKHGDFGDYMDLISDDYVFYAPAGPFRGVNVGKERAKEFYQAIVDAKADFEFSEPLVVTSNDNTVVIEFTDKGTLMGKPYFNRIASSFDISNGKIVGYREYFGEVDVEALQSMVQASTDN